MVWRRDGVITLLLELSRDQGFLYLLLPHPLGCSLHLLVKTSFYNHIHYQRRLGDKQCLSKGMTWELHIYLSFPSHEPGLNHMATQLQRRLGNVVSNWETTCPAKTQRESGYWRSTLGICCKQRGGSERWWRILANQWEPQRNRSLTRPWMRRTPLLYMNMFLPHSYMCYLYKWCNSTFSAFIKTRVTCVWGIFQ